MSQSGLFTEAELPEHIYRYFDIKLDKEAFIRPTKDVVMEIYKRFLDKTSDDWMKPKYPGDEPIMSARMICNLKHIFRQCNTQVEFKASDVFKPDRRRTISFLNVLIYIRVQWDQCHQYLQQCEAEHAEKQEEEEKKNQIINDLKVEIEELALKIGQCPVSIHDWKDRLKIDDQKLEQEKNDCKELEDAKVEIKRRIAEEDELIRIRSNEMVEFQRRLDESKVKSQLAQEAATLQDKLQKEEAALKQMKLEEDMRRKELELELQQLELEKSTLMQRHSEDKANWIKQRDDLNKQCEETQRRTDEQTALREQAIKDASRRSHDKITEHETIFENEETTLKNMMNDFNTKLNLLIGFHDTNSAKNATFIKSMAND